MNNKLQSLMRYAENLQQRLVGTIPKKHQGNEEVYFEYLKRELYLTNKSIELLKSK